MLHFRFYLVAKGIYDKSNFSPALTIKAYSCCHNTVTFNIEDKMPNSI